MVNNSQTPWTTISSTYVYSDEWLRLRSDTVKLPNGTILAPFHTLEVPDSVNVIAITEDQSVLLVEQYRHSVRRISLEIPAGTIDSGEKPIEAAKRELLEETGFAGGEWRLLGATFPFSSRLNCVVHGFLALDVKRECEPRPDLSEIIRVTEMPWSTFAKRLFDPFPLLHEANQLAMALLAARHIEDGFTTA